METSCKHTLHESGENQDSPTEIRREIGIENLRNKKKEKKRTKDRKKLKNGWNWKIPSNNTIFNCNIPRESKKKQDTLLLSVTSPVVDRFSKFFHQRSQQ